MSGTNLRGPAGSRQHDSDGGDPHVTRLLRELYAAPADANYWSGLEARIMARVSGGHAAVVPTVTEWWQVFGEWMGAGLAAAAVAALLAGATLMRERDEQRQVAYRSVLEASASRPTPPAVDDRDGALSYFLSPR